MPIITIEGFKAYKDIDGKISIVVNSSDIKGCMQIYTNHHLDGVVVSISHNYELQNIDFLADYPNIERLQISEGIKNISAIHKLHKLKYLFIAGRKREIDFSVLPLLKNLNIEWSLLLSNMDKCKSLETLILRGYNPKNKDCLSLPNVTWVERLELIESTICSLNGLEYFQKLKKLAFYYCSKLETLCCLESSNESLTYLFFDHCKSIKNHEYVTTLAHLNTLAYNDCGIIPSIKFIKKMTSLKDIRFVGTDISDGDMTPCIGLKYAAFSNKKHFSHTMEKIKSLSNT
jgi:protein phosphatase 1 regulatory subunit 7